MATPQETVTTLNTIVADYGDNLAELQNIRVGADGTTHVSAGDAVRGQVGDLKSDIAHISSDGFAKNNFAWQKGGLNNSGEITTQLYRIVTTDLLTTTKAIVFRNINPAYKYSICYQKDEVWKGTGWISTNENHTCKIPADCSYRIVIAKASEDYRTLSDSEVAEMSNIIYPSTNVYNAYFDIALSKNASLYGNGIFNPTDFIIGIHYSSNNSYYKDTARVTTAEKMSFPFDTKIKIKSGYRYCVITLDSQGSPVSDTGWITVDYFIPANTNFYLNIDNGNTSATANIEDYVEQIEFSTPLALEIDSLKGVGSYSYEGVNVKPQHHGFNTSQLGWSYSSPTTQGTFTSQAMSYNNGVVFKCWKNDLIQLYKFTDGTKIAEYAITCEHADCMDFSNEYYDSNDEFPLAYFTSDTSPLKVYVNRLTRTSGTLIRTLLLPIENAGYYAGHAVDAVNNRLVTLGYSENNFETNPNGTNYMICTVWDLNSLTLNQDGTYTPALLKSFTLPFMVCTQDQCYYNNKLFVISSNWQNTNTVIYAIDIGEESVVATFSDIPYKAYETEGIFWVNSDMYVNGNGITKYTFV